MRSKKQIIIFSSVSLLAIIIFIFSMSYFGAEGFSWFAGFNPTTNKGKNSVATITWSLLVVGAGLSIAGAAMQGITRNKLASAYSLGSTASAMLAIIFVTYVFKPENPWLHMFLVLMVSILISSLFLLISFSPKVSPSKVIVIGLIVSVFLSSITYLLRVKYSLTAEMISFLALDTFNATWDSFMVTAPIILLASCGLLLLGKKIQIFEANPEKAMSLGIGKNQLRGLSSFLVILIATCSVYLVGPIAFIGILIPHLSRMLLGNLASTRKIMLLSIPLSTIILLLAQIFTRAFFRYSFTINVLIALIAGPIIIYKIIRGNYV